MPSEEPKPTQPAATQEADAELRGKQIELMPAAAADDDDDDDDDGDQGAGEDRAHGNHAGTKKSKKKKSKRKKVKELLMRGSGGGGGGGGGDGESSSGNMAESGIKKAISGLTPQQTKELLALNPSLANEVAQAAGSASPTAEQTADLLNKMKLQDIMTGLAASGKNVKDMGAYKFWQTQPIPRFGEEDKVTEEGPLRIQTVDEVSTEPQPLVAGFEWVTMDLGSDEEIKEVYELLNGHYVEDDEANFRFSYSPAILRWAMMAPGWQRKYHIGVRASQSRKLVAFISAIPVRLRVRDKTFVCSEVNFLCVHKKLRGKRLAPVLIKEVTRISNLDGVWQGLYTAGIVLPKSVSTCRYYHRSINWQKLHECGFSPLPAGSKPQYQIRKYALPDRTATQGLRAMREQDVEAVAGLMKRYLARFDLAPELTREEAQHWFLPKGDGQRVVWTYVVEDDTKKITDFFSFFSIESSVINNSKHDRIRVAYLFYYASETGLRQPADQAGLKRRLNELINDALILARSHKFDVFNALSLMDNALFLEQQKFGAGDGQLHYYLFNYRMNHVGGGVDKRNQLDTEHCSGLGLVMP